MSRRAFDLVLDERDRLRAEVDELMAHVKRMDRVEHGLLELPYERPAPPEGMPTELQEYVDGWQDRNIRREVVRSIVQARQDGKEWDQIIREVTDPETARL